MPTPVITHGNLGWAYQTAYANRVKTPSSFLTQLVFGGREETLPTETIELSYREGERFLAPFVELNAEAIPVGTRSTTFANVSAPNIKLKRPMEAYNHFLRRQPGTGMFITSARQVAAARQAAIAEDTLFMTELIENRVEWMVSQLVTGMTSGFMRLEYQVEDRANFRISIPRSTDMTATLGSNTNWNGSAPNIRNNVHAVKRIFSKHINAPLATCVMGSTAADYFMDNEEIRKHLDTKNVSAGALNLQAQFGENGAIYLGRIYGCDFWEYSREYNDGTSYAPGSNVPFVGAEKAIFIAGGNALSDSKIYYGCIPDHDAFEQGSMQTKRFSKSWKEPDPSIFVQLMQTRPLPMIRQPNAIVVMDVIV